MTEPFNLDAVVTEQTGTPFPFTFGGEAYELPATVDVFVALAFKAGDALTGLQRLLGETQWVRMLESDTVMDEPRLVALLEAYKEHIGVGLGESVASALS